jgi:hypothetical protein
MGTHRATVKNGRLLLDEPTSLPEGAVLELVVDDEGDDLDEAERQALHEHLAAAWKTVQEGKVRPVEEILAELHARR